MSNTKEIPCGAYNPEEALIKKQEFLVVCKAFKRLTYMQKLVISWRYGFNDDCEIFSYKEIAIELYKRERNSSNFFVMNVNGVKAFENEALASMREAV
jgi:hypothetical protein